MPTGRSPWEPITVKLAPKFTPHYTRALGAIKFTSNSAGSTTGIKFTANTPAVASTFNSKSSSSTNITARFDYDV